VALVKERVEPHLFKSITSTEPPEWGQHSHVDHICMSTDYVRHTPVRR
jgi:hypothetical protein